MWREERAWDRVAVLASVSAGAAGAKLSVVDILGRDVGDSRVPGYRPGDAERRRG